MTNLKIILFLLLVASLVLLGLAIFDSPVIGDLNWFWMWFQVPVLGGGMVLQLHIEENAQ